MLLINILLLVPILVMVFVYFILPHFLKYTKWGNLHPGAALLIFFRNLLGENILEMNIEKFRHTFQRHMGLIEGVKPVIFSTPELKIRGDGHDVPVKFYVPSREKDLPVTVYFHGGGFVWGGIKTVDTIARHIALYQKTIVVSVEYPLAPEYPFPAAVEASYSVLCWTRDHVKRFGGDPKRIRVAGDSAGGNLAAEMCFLSRERKGPDLEAQILLYPWVDLTDTGSESFSRYGRDFLLSTEEINWFKDLYLTDPAQAALPGVSPSKRDDFRGLPPAVVLVCQFDVLHDQGTEYYDKLKKAGVPVSLIEMNGFPHGALSMTGWVRRPLIQYYKKISRELDSVLIRDAD